MAPVADEYASVDDLRAELERLREENAALRAQIEELTMPPESSPSGRRGSQRR